MNPASTPRRAAILLAKASITGASQREMEQLAERTQAALAERCGVSRKTVNTVENGVFVPSTLLALKLAAALDRRVEELFWVEG